MKVILGIETSCDETAAAVLEQKDKRINILSNVVASSIELQAKYGGVIPEQAAREQLKSIVPVVEHAIHDSRLTINDLDAIAVTQGPGLIGSLLVGVETAKVLAMTWNKPLIPINHLVGHFYANWAAVRGSLPTFPSLGLLVSGGHSDLVMFTNHNKYKYLGGTRDDAAGEAFDKSARLLGLPYPGGPLISKLAKEGNRKAFHLPRPMMKGFSAKGGPASDWDFSFSGLKTAVLNLVNQLTPTGSGLTSQQVSDISASLETAIVDTLVIKTIKAAKTFGMNQLIVSGGVAANQYLRERLFAEFPGKVFIPPPSLCTDNAVMIATAGFFTKPIETPLDLQANPNLSLNV